MNNIAFDLHGVLDTYSHLRQVARMVYEKPSTDMVIITGSLLTPSVQTELSALGVKYDKFFSITEYLLSACPEEVTWIDGNPFADDEIWNSAKAGICELNNIDLLYDDSPVYGEYFEDIKTLYIEVHSGLWKESGRHLRKNNS